MLAGGERELPCSLRDEGFDLRQTLNLSACCIPPGAAGQPGGTDPGPAGAWQEEEEEESQRAASVPQAARRAWLPPALKSATFTPSSPVCRHGGRREGLPGRLELPPAAQSPAAPTSSNQAGAASHYGSPRHRPRRSSPHCRAVLAQVFPICRHGEEHPAAPGSRTGGKCTVWPFPVVFPVHLPSSESPGAGVVGSATSGAPGDGGGRAVGCPARAAVQR